MSDLDRRLEALSPERQLLLERLRSERSAQRAAERMPIEPRPSGDRDVPLSSQQARLWFLEQLDPGRGTYNVYEAVRLSGPLDAVALRRAIDDVVGAHEAVRTTFHLDDGVLVQRVGPTDGLPLAEIDFEGFPGHERDAAVHQHVWALSSTAFDLESGPLMRVSLIRCSAEEHVLVLVMHHIVSDGWSLGVLLSDISGKYEAHRRGTPVATEPGRLHYGDYAHWQQTTVRSKAAGDRAYWKQQLDGLPPAIDLPEDRAAPSRRTGVGGRCVFVVDQELALAVHELARAQRATAFMVLAAGFALTLHHTGSGDDIPIGTPVAGRDRPELEAVVGPFINTLVLRARLDGDPTVAEVVARIRDTTLEAFDHAETPFEEIVEAIGPERTANRSPLFQAMFVLQDAPVSLAADSLELSVLQTHNATAKFDLTMSLTPDCGGYRGSIEYAVDRFDDATIDALCRRFTHVLQAMVDDPDRPIGEVDAVDPAERELVLHTWNKTESSVPAGLVHEWVAGQADLVPQRTAVQFGDESISYRELDGCANLLAHRLVDAGVGPETVIGVALPRSPDLVIALLAVLKAGAAYIPLDLEHPTARLCSLVADAGCPAVIGDPGCPDLGVPIVVVPGPGETGAAPWPTRPEVASREDGVAYVIYTSGSTGQPKGVMSTHSGLANRLAWMQKAYALGPADRVLQKTPTTFDVSVWELFWPLSVGATLVVAPPAVHRDPAALVDLIVEHQITTVHFVPSMLRAVLAEPGAPRCTSLERVIASGEALTADVLEQFDATFTAELHNLYGPTEASIDVSAWACPSTVGLGRVPIGKPIANTQLYVLDRVLRPVGIGVPGELCIGGVGLARGYLGQPARTAASFVPHPFDAGQRLYRTGDVARWNSRGELEFLGRTDDQVKIRGVRVEPGEVEAVLGVHDGIRAAAVVAHLAGLDGVRLVAYVVPKPEATLTADGLREHLAQRLPASHVPARIILADDLPRSASGKVDRGRLAQQPLARDLGSQPVAPVTPTEASLVRIWEEVLGIDGVGTTDNYFSLGGDSMRSIQVTSRAALAGIWLSVGDLFEHQTVRELASVARSQPDERSDRQQFSLVGAVDLRRLPPGLVDAFPLAASQAGMVFDTELDADPTIYHDVFSYHLRGSIGRAELDAALDRLARRHPALRTSFDLTSYTEPLQLIHTSSSIPLGWDDLASYGRREQDAVVAAWIEAEKAEPFDWSVAPLFRVHVHHRGPDSLQLSVSCHNVLLDGWSMATILSELFLDVSGTSPIDPTPVQSYGYFVALERTALASAEARLYWEGILDRFEPAPLPRWPRAEEPSGRRGFLSVELDPWMGRDLDALARRLGLPLKSLLLAVHLRVVGAMTGQRRAVTGVVVNGRLEQPGSAEATGMYLNIVPMGADLGAGSWESLAREMLRTEGEVQSHRRFPMPQLRAERRRQPWFEVAFNFVDFHVYEAAKKHGLAVRGSTTYDDTNVPFWSEFSMHPLDRQLRLDLRYDCQTVSDAQARAVGDWYRRALEHLAGAPDAPHAEALERGDLLRGEERDAPGVLGEPASIDAMFRDVVRRVPDQAAFWHGSEAMTFRGLAVRVAHVEACLRDAGVRRHAAVGVLLERGFDAPAALFAIWRIGAVYVPLDPGLPAARLEAMASAAGVVVVVVAGASPPFPATVVVDLAEPADETRLASTLPPVASPQRDDVAYVVFTSGSTGKPKGVAVPHRQVLNRLRWMWFEHPFQPGEVAAMRTSIGFVDSLWELLGAALVGVPTAIIRDEDSRDPERLVTALARRGVTRLWLVPTLLRAMLDGVDDLAGRLHQLVFWVCTGEPLDTELYAQFERALPQAVLFNLYGTSEVWDATWFDPRVGGIAGSTVPIGDPIWNGSALVVDHTGSALPAGMPGELVIGGVGVAHGYVGAPAATAEVFVPDPLGAPGSRRYRTGDRAWTLPGHGIQLLGRLDAQSKIRGVRVEPAEVEAVLRTHPTVADAAVLVQGDLLVGFVVGREGATADVAAVLAAARQLLPPSMQPSRLVTINRLPLTSSGKVDRLTLAEVPLSATPAAGGDPRTTTEQILVDLFHEFLGVEGIGTEDDFLSLGGHSLVAMRLIARLRRVFDIELPIASLFEGTVRELADRLDRHRSARGDRPRLRLEARARGGRSPASHAQRRLWFLHQLDPDGAAYNVFVAVRLRGPLKVDALSRALHSVVARHESLRTTFELLDGEVLQVVHDDLGPEVHVDELPPGSGETEVRDLARAWVRRPFDLGRGPLVRARCTKAGSDDHVVVLSLHHVVCDGWSIEILLREVMQGYAAAVRGDRSKASPLVVQYADYARHQAEVLKPDVLAELLERWSARLRGAPSALPLGRRPSSGVDRAGGVVDHLVASNLLEGVHELARSSGATPFIVLLAALDVVLWTHTGSSDLVVGTDVAGRTEVELEDAIGFFVNQLALRVRIQPEASFAELLAEARFALLDALADQDLPFDLLVAHLRLQRSAQVSESPLFEVKLVFQSVPELTAPTPGLEVTALDVERGTAQLPLNIRAAERADGLLLSAEYASGRLDTDEVEMLLACLEAVLAAIVADPAASLRSLAEVVEAETGRWAALAADRRQRDAAARLRRAGRQAVRDPGAQQP